MPPATVERIERPEKEDNRMDREKAKAVELAVGQIEKQFGKGSIMRLGQKGPIQPIDAISTGSISIDYALGVGGVPRGRVIEIFGPESSGKTTLALQVIAEAQKLGGMAAFVDAEHALDAAYAQKLGVDLDNLLVSQPDNGEQALEIVEVLIRSTGVDVVVVDSVAALVPKAEIEGDMGDAQMGLQARLMSQALRKLTGVVSKSKTSLIFINQLREKIGVMFGNPETTTGGRALKFYASVRVDIRRIASIKDGDAVVGGRTRVKIVKNKVAPPFREAEFDVMYGEGISRMGDLLDLAVEKRIIEKSGAWFAYGGERLGQGRENAKQFLKENPDIARTIEDRVRRELGLVRDIERRRRITRGGRARHGRQPWRRSRRRRRAGRGRLHRVRHGAIRRDGRPAGAGHPHSVRPHARRRNGRGVCAHRRRHVRRRAGRRRQLGVGRLRTHDGERCVHLGASLLGAAGAPLGGDDRRGRPRGVHGERARRAGHGPGETRPHRQHQPLGRAETHRQHHLRRVEGRDGQAHRRHGPRARAARRHGRVALSGDGADRGRPGRRRVARSVEQREPGVHRPRRRRAGAPTLA